MAARLQGSPLDLVVERRAAVMQTDMVALVVAANGSRSPRHPFPSHKDADALSSAEMRKVMYR